MLHNILRDIVGDEGLIDNQIEFETDWRGVYRNPAVAVVQPSTIEQIKDLITVCKRYNIKIVPQGGNTSLCGSAVPVPQVQQLIINMSRFNKIIDINEANLHITLEAGVTLSSVIAAAKQYNLLFPLYIASASQCQIGGNIATNAGGIHVIKYGMMRNLLLGLEVILPSGSVVNQMYSLRKSNLGMDVKQLFVGSEGTMGIITKAVLRLFPSVKSCTVFLRVAEIDVAISLLMNMRCKFDISAFEIINSEAFAIYAAYNSNNFTCPQGEYLLIIDVDCDIYTTDDMIMLQVSQYKVYDIVVTHDTELQRSIWNMRANIPIAEKQHGGIIKHDIALPLHMMKKFLANNLNNLLALDSNATVVMFGHLGDGNLHYNVRSDFNASLISDRVYKDVIIYGGSFAAEHGIGVAKKKIFTSYCDSGTLDVLKSIKRTLDPDNLFNYGKVLDI